MLVKTVTFSLIASIVTTGLSIAGIILLSNKGKKKISTKIFKDLQYYRKTNLKLSRLFKKLVKYLKKSKTFQKLSYSLETKNINQQAFILKLNKKELSVMEQNVFINDDNCSINSFITAPSFMFQRDQQTTKQLSNYETLFNDPDSIAINLLTNPKICTDKLIRNNLTEQQLKIFNGLDIYCLPTSIDIKNFLSATLHYNESPINCIIGPKYIFMYYLHQDLIDYLHMDEDDLVDVVSHNIDNIITDLNVTKAIDINDLKKQYLGILGTDELNGIIIHIAKYRV